MPRARLDPLSLATPLLLFGLAVWFLAAPSRAPGDPLPAASAAAIAAVCFLGARFAPSPLRLMVPLGVLIAAISAVVLDPSGTLGRGPTDGVFGYANAKGQFFALAGLAALLLRARLSHPLRNALVLVAALSALIPLATQSVAAGFLLIATGAATLAPRPARPLIAGGMVLAFVGALATTIALGALYDRGAAATPPALGERRLALWSDAVAFSVDHPVGGIGLGRFPHDSVVALADVDTRQAHHGFLQVAAESGILGGSLLAGAFIVPLIGVARRARPRAAALVGAAVVTTFGIHATVDYVMHFPWLVVVAAALAGAAEDGTTR